MLLNEISVIKEVTLSKSKIYLREDNIMVFEVFNNVEIEVENMEEMIMQAGIIGGGNKYPNLILAGKYATISNAAQQVMDKEESLRYTNAEAIVIQSLSQRILGNFYLRIVSKRIPARLFNSKDKAIAWLKQYQ